jgi:hypothetical protein
VRGKRYHVLGVRLVEMENFELCLEYSMSIQLATPTAMQYYFLNQIYTFYNHDFIFYHFLDFMSAIFVCTFEVLFISNK